MYATMDDLIQELDIDTGADNVLLEGYLRRAQATIERRTNKVFEATADTTLTFDADLDVDGALLTWAQYNLWLASITSVTNGDSTTVTSAQYVTEPRRSAPYYGIRLLASTSLAWEYPSNGNPEDAITIVGRWAWSVSAPDDIRQATIRLATWFYRQRDNVDMDRAFVTGNTTVLPARIPTDIDLLLEPYMVDV